MNHSENTSTTEGKKGTTEFWQDHYDAFQSSGLSRASYSRQHQLDYHQFSYWCRKINQVAPGDDSASDATNFLPVHIHTEQQSDTNLKALCTLELNTHCRLLIHTPVAIETVVQLLRRAPC